MQQGYELLKGGKLEMAAYVFHRALKIRADLLKAHLGFGLFKDAREDYRRVLRRFHDWLSPARYMEIGVEDGSPCLWQECLFDPWELILPPKSSRFKPECPHF